MVYFTWSPRIDPDLEIIIDSLLVRPFTKQIMPLIRRQTLRKTIRYILVHPDMSD
jgi:hypothetical protein